MAAFNYDDYRASDEGGRFAAVLNWGGAVLSLILIAGLATWGWKLWVRDVTGVPVVRALEGPMRVAPEEPGGLASEYQGLTVNRIAEERAADAPSEQVVLAPAPATLNEEEDLAMAELPAVAPEPEPGLPVDAATVDSVPVAPEEELIVVNEPPLPAIGEAERIVLADDEGDLPAVADLDEADETVAAVAAEPEPEPTQSATDLAVAAALADLGLKPEPAVLKVEAAAGVPVITPRPVMRPANLQRVALTTPQASEAVEVPGGEIDASAIMAGTRLVQLGAFSSADVARDEWAETEGRYSDYFAGKTRVIQEVSSGGREFYRLRVAGFDSLSDARRFCAVIVADGTNCIPVIHQ